MRFKMLGVLGAVLMVSACTTDSENAGAGSTGGDQSGGATVETGSSTIQNNAPTGPAPGSQEELASIGDRVLFGFDRYDLDNSDRATLRRQAAFLERYPNVSIAVEGHCDERGTREYNLALGERRANAVKEYLVSLGVSANRVQTVSWGKERPVATCSDESCYNQNRRDVTVVTGGATN